jgi:hypothetical protein
MKGIFFTSIALFSKSSQNFFKINIAPWNIPSLKKESSKSAKLSQSNQQNRFDVAKATIKSDTCKRRGRYGEYSSV